MYNWYFNNFFFFTTGGAFDGVEDIGTPFGYKRGEGIDAGHGEPEWVVNKFRSKYDQIFENLGPIAGKVSGEGREKRQIFNEIYLGCFF